MTLIEAADEAAAIAQCAPLAAGSVEALRILIDHARATVAQRDQAAPEGEMPELWWHPVHSVLMPVTADGHDYGWYILEEQTWLDERPEGAVRLAPAPTAEPAAQRDEAAPEGKDLATWLDEQIGRARRQLAEAERNDRELTAASEGERLATLEDVRERLAAPSAATAPQEGEDGPRDDIPPEPAGSGAAVDRDALVEAFMAAEVVNVEDGEDGRPTGRWETPHQGEAERMADVALAALRDAGGDR